MRKILAGLLLFFPVASFAQAWKSFNKADILFTAKYPADWANKIKEGKRVFFTSPAEGESDDFRQNVNVSVSSDPQYGSSLKIKDVIQEIIDQVKLSFNEFNEESRTPMKWNGIDAYEITYSGITKTDGISARITQRLCFYKTRLYLATYTALKAIDVYAAVALQIINSIKFKP
ncbi:MAG: hypothetical protein JNM14_07790 [Ferruginibacter sp.]|nr:hypothetical protein [Ferruginibacter sp.]